MLLSKSETNIGDIWQNEHQGTLLYFLIIRQLRDL